MVSILDKSETKGISCLYPTSHFRLVLFLSFLYLCFSFLSVRLYEMMALVGSYVFQHSTV